jgi:K(+)-stimulated pyrophosphate-energized sodium pump
MMLGHPRLVLLAMAMMAAFVCLPSMRPAAAAAPAGAAPVAQIAPTTAAAVEHSTGGEANLKLPDLNLAKFFNNSIGGGTLLTYGLIFCVAGVIFGLVIYMRLKNMAVHPSMLEVSELIYATCKTYLLKQGKFLLMLWGFIALVMLVYFGYLNPIEGKWPLAITLPTILVFSLLGMAGSYAVAAFGMRVNTFANSRCAFAALKGKPYPCYNIPLQAGMSIGMLLVSLELIMMLAILLFVPGDLAGACFIGFAIGESLGAAALRVAGGIFTKIADIGADLMKIVFKIKEDDARNPGVIADCTGDNAGDSVGPSADGFETYGVTGVALIVFILLAVSGKDHNEDYYKNIQVQLLVWIFTIRVVMLVAAAVAYFVNGAIAKAKYANADKMNYEAPLTSLVWVTSILSIILTYVVSYFMIPNLANNASLWWKLSTIISCGTLAGALIPEFVKVFTSTHSGHVKEIVTSSKEGGASLNILSGLVAGNFSAFWLGLVMLVLMAIGYGVATTFPTGAGAIMMAPAVFAFGLVAFGFLGMGPVTIAVDSYGPVTDNAQSVYELSTIENLPNAAAEIERQYGFKPHFDKAKENLEENDGAGNTFKATAKPVLIGTAVVGATTMIFSTIVYLTDHLQNTEKIAKLSLLHAPFLLGMVAGGAVIYWFTGASIQAVTAGAYRAVEFIKRNIKLESTEKASVEDSKKVVGICTEYAQKGMINIFFTVFFATLAFAFVDPFFFVGYLVSIALFGLYQAIFMANAGGAWDNAKKVVETELKAKGTPLHDASVVGDTVGDPFKDTSSVALNPIIKFTTLFGLLAVELAVALAKKNENGEMICHVLAGICLLIALCFVYRSFYGMRISNNTTA